MRIRILLVLVAVLTIVGVGNAQYEDWNLTGAGARAEGLGGAFIGLADDATAISWNPSGLGQLDRVEFSAVGRWIGEEFKYNDPLYPSSNSTLTQSRFAYNFASIAFPLHAGKVNIVPAVAFQKQLDSYTRISMQEFSFESNGGAYTITPGIGFKLHPMIYVGGAVNIWLGSEDYTFDYTYTYLSTVYKEKEIQDGTFSGLNFSAGLLVDFEGMKKPIPIKFGATVKTPFELKRDGGYQLLENGAMYQKGTKTSTIQMPFMIGLGASGRIGDNLTLAVDYEARLFGDRNRYDSWDGTSLDTAQMSDNNSNLYQLRVGAEYLIVTDVGVIPVRAGFRTVPTLVADYDDKKSAYADQVVGTGFTVGTGFISQSFAFDVTYARSSYEQSDFMTGGTATSTYTSQIVSASLIVYF